MNKPVDLSHLAARAEEDSNTSDNPHFAAVLDARLSRRGLLRGSVGTAATALFGSVALAGCGGGDDDTPAPTTPDAGALSKLGFTAVPKSLEDKVTLAAGYTATVVYALGDPLTATTAAYKNDGTDTDYGNRAGDHHDGMEWFSLGSDGSASTTASDRGLLAINHEATTDEIGRA